MAEVEPGTTEQYEAPPDWAAVNLDLGCPRCGYNLRMLTVARCPECGLRFSWPEVLQAAEDERTGGWTFEYRWRSRPVRAFFQTIWLCLLPWRPWTRIPLSATPRVGPLLLLVPATALLLVLVSVATEFAWQAYIKLWYAKARGISTGFFWSWTPHEPLGKLATPLLLCLPLWLAVQVFRQTIVRYRIRQAHILRILVFTWMAVVAWPALCEVVLTFAVMPYRWWFRTHLPSAVSSVSAMIPSFVLVTSLGFAFSAYLRVRGGWLWALVVLTLAAFFVTMPGVLISVYYYQSFSNPYWEPIVGWFPPTRLLPDVVEYAFLWLHEFP
ncbi:MAG: hypothetical protein IID42_06530 [Planctomycetes bacterium]|nr:hypothetical protein [Planctomycetota bacterium]